MKLSQMCRNALIATMIMILSSRLDTRGFAQANSPQGAKGEAQNLLPLPPAIPRGRLCLHSLRTVGVRFLVSVRTTLWRCVQSVLWYWSIPSSNGPVVSFLVS
jgi:hypothetical protein